jgi:PIN domain nuclease of toxin-antitoxin system
MADYVSDTHALIWHLTRDARLSAVARSAFEEADNGLHTIWIPGIVLVEAVYLVEKARFPMTLITQMLSLLDSFSHNYLIAPLDVNVIRALQTIDRNVVPDMPDRIIAATARSLGYPLLSKDSNITSVPDLTVMW